MHSTHSDGEFTPEQIVLEAKRRGVQAMAITDHDEISGYVQALPTAKQNEITLLSGLS
jgi:predicted metal-dependent phosphoesterase TrpH